MKVRPPEEEELKSIDWPTPPIVANNKSVRKVPEGEVSFGQKSLTSSLKKPSTRRKKSSSPAKSTPRRRKKTEKEK